MELLHRATRSMEAGIPQKEWLQRWKETETERSHWFLWSNLHVAYYHSCPYSTGRNYTRVSIPGGRDNWRSSWRLATAMTDWMKESVTFIFNLLSTQGFFLLPVKTDLILLLLKCAQECECKPIINLYLIQKRWYNKEIWSKMNYPIIICSILTSAIMYT